MYSSRGTWRFVGEDLARYIYTARSWIFMIWTNARLTNIY